MYSFAVYYIEANAVCILIFGIMLLHNHFNIDRQEKQIKFDHALVAFMLYFLADCFWAAITTEMIPKTRFSVVLDSFFLYIFMGATVYFWLGYVKAYIQVPNRNRLLDRFAVVFPFLVSTAALIVHYLIAPQTLIDGAQDILPAFSIYIAVVPDIYIAAILFYTLRKARNEEDRAVKRRYLFIGFFPLLVTIGGLVETAFFPHVPIYCFTCLILMLVFYIQSIMGQVSLDPLTGLNNRGQLTRYVSQKSNLYQAGKQNAVVMMDVDNFKGINDTYGHEEGDKALVSIADSLKKVMNRRSIPCFLGRYGGDEFILIVHPDTKEEIDGLVREIRDEVEQHDFSISIGYDALRDGEDSIKNCIQRADEKLYQDKARRKRH